MSHANNMEMFKSLSKDELAQLPIIAAQDPLVRPYIEKIMKCGRESRQDLCDYISKLVSTEEKFGYRSKEMKLIKKRMKFNRHLGCRRMTQICLTASSEFGFNSKRATAVLWFGCDSFYEQVLMDNYTDAGFEEYVRRLVTDPNSPFRFKSNSSFQ